MKEELIEMAKDFVTHVLAQGMDADDFIHPYAFCATPQGTALIMLTGANIPQQREFLEEFNDREYTSDLVVINEIWAACPETDEDRALVDLHMAGGGRPCDLPEHLRAELVHVIYESRDGTLEVHMANVKRVDGKKVLEPWEQGSLMKPYPSFQRYFKHKIPEMGNA